MFRQLRYCAVRGFAPLSVDPNDPWTVYCAFSMRLLRVLPAANPRVLSQLASFVLNFIADVPVADRIMSFSEWLARTSYDQDRKDHLTRVYERRHGEIPPANESAHVDSFVKQESYPKYKPGRMINSRIDDTKVTFGPMIKTIEDVVYAWLFGMNNCPFIKHVPVTERPAALRELQKCVGVSSHVYSSDYKAFESHFVVGLMRVCECELYKHVLRGNADVSKMCDVLVGLNKMRTRTGVRATCRARRMSGDMCTSLGNGFTNLVVMMFICRSKGCDAQGYVEGDDGIFVTDAVVTSADFARLGFTIEIFDLRDEGNEVSKASFCGLLVSTDGCIIRDPIKFLCNFAWTGSFITAGPKIMDELLRAKALSALWETPNCPIVSILARYALRQTRGVTPRFIHDEYHSQIPVAARDESGVPKTNITYPARLLMEEQYGISVATQLAVEAAIEKGDFEAVSQLIQPPADVLDYASRFLEVD